MIAQNPRNDIFAPYLALCEQTDLYLTVNAASCKVAHHANRSNNIKLRKQTFHFCDNCYNTIAAPLALDLRDLYAVCLHRWRACAPRCEFCRHRGTYNVGAGDPALLCGRCKTRARNAVAKKQCGILMFNTLTGDNVRAILSRETDGALC